MPLEPNVKHPNPKTALLLAISIALIGAGVACFFLQQKGNPSPITTPVLASTAPKGSPAAKLPATTSLGIKTVESIEALAEQDASRALDLVRTEPDIDRYENFLQAALRGWARSDPDAAADWALAQTRLDQGRAMAAIFIGANKNPATAVLLAQRLSKQHPEEAGSYGSYLIFGLAQVGQFELGATYAAASPNDICTNLLAGAYSSWARQQPEMALRSSMEIADPAKQDTAFHATINGWSHTNPQSLTEAAYKFPEGPDRAIALTGGLRAWLEKDPAAAGEWMANHKLTPTETERALEE